MRTIFKWINIFFSIGLVFVALGVAYVAIPYFGNQALIVRSGSMSPTIDAGSIVVVRPDNKFISPIPFTPIYNEGDIIAFRSENNPKTIITHRIVSSEAEKTGVFYKTKGDANKSVDGWLVNEQNILGRTFFTLPLAGYLLAFTKSNIGFPLLVILPALMVILLEIRAIYKEIRRQKALFQTQLSSNVSVITLKVLLPIFIFMTIFVFGSTSAFFSDSETSTGNTFTAAEVFPHLVINEVMSNPPNSNACGAENDAEWVEIFNPTASSVNLDTWLIGDRLFTDDLPNVDLPAGGFAVVSDCTQSSFITIWALPVGTIYIDLSSAIGNGLANGGEHMRLFNGATLIDDMSYGSNTDAFSPSVPAPVADHSIERDPDGVDTDTNADFVDRTVPTPGS